MSGLVVWMLIVLLQWISISFKGLDASPVSTCPAHVVVFIADTSSQCVFHRCDHGSTLTTHRCPPGSVVPRDLRVTTDPGHVCSRSRNPYACSGDAALVGQYKRDAMFGGGAGGGEERGGEYEDPRENSVSDGSGDVHITEPTAKQQQIVTIPQDPDSNATQEVDEVDAANMISAERGHKQPSGSMEYKESSKGYGIYIHDKPAAAVKPTHSAAPLDTTGYALHVDESHVLGGSVVGRGMTLQQCLDLCHVTSRCLAVDYTHRGGLCWEHRRYTVCGDVRSLKGTVHFKRLPCSPDTEHIREVYVSSHILGGELYCTDCSAATCLRGCRYTATCNSADYNHRHRTCHLHMALTGCKALMVKDGCTHFKKNTCPTPPPLSRPPPPFLSAPLYNPVIYTCNHPCVPPTDAREEYGALFLPVRRPAPSVLPSGWAAYPAARLGGGELVATDRTGNGCFATCDGDDACSGVDFDSDTGYCYVYGQEDVCQELMVEEYSTWYHVKKSPCDKPEYNPILCACA